MLRKPFVPFCILMAALVSTSAAFAYDDGMGMMDTPRPQPSFGKQWWEVDGTQASGNPQRMRVDQEKATSRTTSARAPSTQPTLGACRDMQRNARPLLEAVHAENATYARCIASGAFGALEDDCAPAFDALQNAQYNAENARRDWRRACE
jgi:hypothetical protein